MNTIQLISTQQQVLEHAADTIDGRGLFAAALKKKIQFIIQPDKSQPDARQYRIV